MPYDSVAYPKITRARPGPTAKAENDSLWLQGFLDHVKENATSLMTEGVAPFMQLPGEGILPQAKAELARLSEQRLIELERDATYTPRFEDGGGDGGGKRDKSSENIKQALTTEESMALTKLDQSLHPQPYRTAYQKNMWIYQRENKKPRAARREKSGQDPALGAVHGHGEPFELNRREVQAAIVLQRGWKRPSCGVSGSCASTDAPREDDPGRGAGLHRSSARRGLVQGAPALAIQWRALPRLPPPSTPSCASPRRAACPDQRYPRHPRRRFSTRRSLAALVLAALARLRGPHGERPRWLNPRRR